MTAKQKDAAELVIDFDGPRVVSDYHFQSYLAPHHF